MVPHSYRQTPVQSQMNRDQNQVHCKDINLNKGNRQRSIQPQELLKTNSVTIGPVCSPFYCARFYKAQILLCKILTLQLAVTELSHSRRNNGETEEMTLFNSVSEILGKTECSFAGVEPTNFRLLVRMLYH